MRPPPSPRVQRSHVVLRAEHPTRRPAIALALRARDDGGPIALFLPLDALPLRGGFLDPSGAPCKPDVITVDAQLGFVLLSLPKSLGGELSPLQVSGPLAQTELFDLSPDGGVGLPVGITGRTQGGSQLQLSRDVAPGAAILTASGLAVAYALGGMSALPLDVAAGWLMHPGTQELEVVQTTLRARDPTLALEDANALIRAAKGPADLARLRQAIELLEQGIERARDPELVRAYDQHLRLAYHALIRLTSQQDPAQALIEAMRALQRFPDHAALLADACLLQLEHGDPRRAVALFSQLQGISVEHAQKTAEPLAKGLVRIARARLRERRAQEAIELLNLAVGLFPRRADLQMARAEALAVLGATDEALAAALEAARIDPAFADEAESLRTAAQRARTPGLVQIPFDPKTSVIQTQVTVSGQPLELVVDTGATLTTIPSALADNLQLRRAGNQRVKVATASGTVEGEVVTLPSLHIGQIEVKNVQAVVLDLPDSLRGKGLLGLNVLQRLNMEIDSKNGLLILRQEGRRRR